MAKSPDAFRTISEVADWLGVQAHVLRFWESKFAQVKPIKRAGGRRYYRPADMLLLGGLKKVLHEDGLTIKGAQKLLREKGVSYVADLSQPLDDLTIAVIEGSSTPVEPAATSKTDVVTPEPSEAPVTMEAEEAEPTAPEPEPQSLDMATGSPDSDDGLEGSGYQSEAASDETTSKSEEEEQPDLPLTEASDAEAEIDETEPAPTITFRARHRDTPRAAAPTEEADAAPEPVEPAPEAPDSAKEQEAPQSLKPNRVDVTLVHDHTQLEVSASPLSAIARLTKLTPEQAQEVRPLLARLTRLRASMANPRKDIGKD